MINEFRKRHNIDRDYEIRIEHEKFRFFANNCEDFDLVLRSRELIMPITVSEERDRKEEYKRYCESITENRPKLIMEKLLEMKESNFEVNFQTLIGRTVTKGTVKTIISEDYIRSFPVEILCSYEDYIIYPLEYFMECATNGNQLPFECKHRSYYNLKPEYLLKLKEIFQFVLTSFDIEVELDTIEVPKYETIWIPGGYGGHYADNYIGSHDEYFLKVILS